MDESRKIEHAALRRLAQKMFSQQPAFRRRSRKENRPQIPAHALDVCRLLSSIDGGYWPVIVSKVIACARPAARFFPENHLLESKVAQRSRPTEWASEFSKRGAIIEGGSESIIAELVCVWASERNRRPSQ